MTVVHTLDCNKNYHTVDVMSVSCVFYFPHDFTFFNVFNFCHRFLDNERFLVCNVFYVLNVFIIFPTLFYIYENYRD